MSYYLGADKLKFYSYRKILTLMFKFSGSKEGSKPQQAIGDNSALGLSACLSVFAFCPRLISGWCSVSTVILDFKGSRPWFVKRLYKRNMDTCQVLIGISPLSRWYLGVFSSTSKYHTQRVFSSPRQPKEVSQSEPKAWLDLPPTSTANGQPDLHFKYI